MTFRVQMDVLQDKAHLALRKGFNRSRWFFDNFHRPDGTPHNGWSLDWNVPTAEIVDGELVLTPGGVGQILRDFDEVPRLLETTISFNDDNAGIIHWSANDYYVAAFINSGGDAYVHASEGPTFNEYGPWAYAEFVPGAAFQLHFDPATLEYTVVYNGVTLGSMTVADPLFATLTRAGVFGTATTTGSVFGSFRMEGEPA